MTLHSQDPADAVAYNILADGPTKKIRPDFELREFRSRDGSIAVLIHPVLADGLQQLRIDSGGAVMITSAHRTNAHNSLIGGVEDSRHLYGEAGDVLSDVWTPPRVQQWAVDMGWGGIGFYHDFTHLDVHGRHRRWGPAR